MITLKKLKEEVDLAQNVRNGDISVDKNPVRENINNLLTTALSCSFVTPYVGLEKVSKVLANFHMHLPKAPYLEGNHGVQVFDLNQFGEMIGMKNDGTVVTKVETPYHVYFEYQMNDKGRYDIFCEVVDDEELDELLDEMEDDMNDVEDEREKKLDENLLKTVAGLTTMVTGVPGTAELVGKPVENAIRNKLSPKEPEKPKEVEEPPKDKSVMDYLKKGVETITKPVSNAMDSVQSATVEPISKLGGYAATKAADFTVGYHAPGVAGNTIKRGAVKVGGHIMNNIRNAWRKYNTPDVSKPGAPQPDVKHWPGIDESFRRNLNIIREQNTNNYMTGPGGIRNPNTRPATPMTPAYEKTLGNVQRNASDNFWSGARTVVPGAQAANFALKGKYGPAATSAATDIASTAAAGGLGKLATTALSTFASPVVKALTPAAAYAASKPPTIAGAQYKSSLEPHEDDISNTPTSKPEVQNMPNTNTTASTKPEINNMPNTNTTASTKPEVQNMPYKKSLDEAKRIRTRDDLGFALKLAKRDVR